MDLSKLFDLQKALDTRIETQHQLQNEDLVDKKVLALLVEIGELANETRCFKFWSLKQPSEVEVILEEFVDGLHFLLSLGLAFGFEKKISIMEDFQETNVVSQFLLIYQEISEFKQARTNERYNRLLNHFFHLGELLGFSSEQITKAYILKNEINHVRQDQGY